MKCQKCARPMVALFLTCVCDYCNPPKQATASAQIPEMLGYVLTYRSYMEPALYNVMRTLEMAMQYRRQKAPSVHVWEVQLARLPNRWFDLCMLPEDGLLVQIQAGPQFQYVGDAQLTPGTFQLRVIKQIA